MNINFFSNKEKLKEFVDGKTSLQKNIKDSSVGGKMISSVNLGLYKLIKSIRIGKYVGKCKSLFSPHF